MDYLIHLFSYSCHSIYLSAISNIEHRDLSGGTFFVLIYYDRHVIRALGSMKIYLPMMSLDGSAFNLGKGESSRLLIGVGGGDQDPYSVNLTFSPGIRIREEVSRVIIPLRSRRLQ